jgi:hypothetical protein
VTTARFFTYWLAWRPLVEALLWVAFVVAELLADLGIDRIGRHILIDHLNDIESRF